MTERARWLAFALIVALVGTFMLSWCTMSPVSAVSRGVHRPPGDVISFSIRGTRVGNIAGGECWGTGKGWTFTNLSGRAKYEPRFDVIWCESSDGSVIVANGYSIIVKNLGGFWEYDGRDVQVGSFGFPDVNVYVEWRYHHTILGATNHQMVTVDMNLHLNGSLDGTIYWERI